MGAWCAKETTKDGISFRKIPKDEVERADLYNIQYVDENGALVDPKRILESFPGEPAKVCYFKPGTSFVDDSGNPVFPG